ncbi:uncharacterized protein LOC116178214 [Photinus pyralis]|uniref:uncharacterized protein LOC116178214 n=1 Tax=Photinus pyralis TaxID=7054 RepID=UPI0012672656|nr:uncharacterized protein LOC116178214 [Photinus pyralis]
MMKIFVLFALCLTLEIGGNKFGKRCKYMDKECLKSSGADKEEVKEALEKCSFEGGKLSAFAECMLKKKTILNDNGTINQQVVKKMVEKRGNSTEANAIAQKCLAMNGTASAIASSLAGCICQLHNLKKTKN